MKPIKVLQVIHGFPPYYMAGSEVYTYKLSKALAKRAGFRCEWCEGSSDLRPWDYRPEAEPAEEGLALLCGRCRELAGGGKADVNELHSLRNALWSQVPAVAEGVARVGRPARAPDADEHDRGGDDVGEGVQRIGDDRDAVEEQADHDLAGEEHRVARDSQPHRDRLAPPGGGCGHEGPR